MSQPDRQTQRQKANEARRARDREATLTINQAKAKKAEINRKNRRLLIITGIALGAAAVTLGGAAVANRLSSPQAPSIRSDNLAEQITRYNTELVGRPDKVIEMGPHIVAAGHRFLAQEVSMDTSWLIDKSSFMREGQFVAISSQALGCTDGVVPDAHAAQANPLTSEAYYNADRLAYYNNGKPSTNAAFNIFRASIHEGHHQLTLLRELESPILIIDSSSGRQLNVPKAKGLLWLVRDPFNDIVGKECHGIAKHNLEEALAEDSTGRIMSKLGFASEVVPIYANVVEAFRSRVIDRLFYGSNNQLRSLYFASSFEQVYGEIGKRLKGSGETLDSNNQMEGQQYLNLNIPRL